MAKHTNISCIVPSTFSPFIATLNTLTCLISHKENSNTIWQRSRVTTCHAAAKNEGEKPGIVICWGEISKKSWLHDSDWINYLFIPFHTNAPSRMCSPITSHSSSWRSDLVLGAPLPLSIHSHRQLHWFAQNKMIRKDHMAFAFPNKKL